MPFDRTRPSRSSTLLGTLALTAVVAGCGGDTESDAAATADAPAAAETMAAPDMTIENVGFSTPESVLHVADGDYYLVSNINGAPLDKDDNGFISKLSPDGEVMDLTFIDGADDDVTLSGPKGMAVVGGTLYVADIDCLRMFDLATGAATGERCVDGASFLNDVAADAGGTVYFTDSGLDASFSPTGTDAVWMLSGGELIEVVAGSELGNPNGIAAMDGGLRVVTFGTGESYRITPAGDRVDAVAIAGSLDGVEPLAEGGWLVSSWETSAVHRVDPDGTVTAVVEGVEAPADIGWDAGRHRVLIPLFNGNAVVFRTLH